VNFKLDSRYRLNLAKGFLGEAQDNLKYQQYRSCVDNCQLSIENSAKAIIVYYFPLGKTHSPSEGLREILKEQELPNEVKLKIEEIIPIIGRHGFEEHILSDYGDEKTYTLPWDIFDEEAAKNSLDEAQLVIDKTEEIVNTIDDLFAGNIKLK